MLDQLQIQRIKPRMPVLGRNDTQFATVERVEGRHLRLERDAAGQAHYIPLDWVFSIDDKVHLDRPNRDAITQWTTKPS
jgi:hypothetical protein